MTVPSPTPRPTPPASQGVSAARLSSHLDTLAQRLDQHRRLAVFTAGTPEHSTLDAELVRTRDDLRTLASAVLPTASPEGPSCPATP